MLDSTFVFTTSIVDQSGMARNMKHVGGLASVTDALQWVFITGHARPGSVTRTLSPAVRCLSRRTYAMGTYRFHRPENPLQKYSRPQAEQPEDRPAPQDDSTTPPQRQFPVPEALLSTNSLVRRPPRYFGPRDAHRPVRDEYIDSRHIVMRIDGVLQTPQLLSDALATIDRSAYYIQQTAAATETSPPVCMVIGKQAAHLADQKRTRNQGKSAMDRTKQIELSWLSDPHDLAHRMDKLEEFLLEGRRVEVIVKNKKRKRIPTMEEATRVIKLVRKRIEAVPGAKEWQEMTGKIGAIVSLWVQGEMSNEVKEREAKRKDRNGDKEKDRGDEKGAEPVDEVEKLLDDL